MAQRTRKISADNPTLVVTVGLELKQDLIRQAHENYMSLSEYSRRIIEWGLQTWKNSKFEE